MFAFGDGLARLAWLPNFSFFFFSLFLLYLKARPHKYWVGGVHKPTHPTPHTPGRLLFVARNQPFFIIIIITKHRHQHIQERRAHLASHPFASPPTTLPTHTHPTLTTKRERMHRDAKRGGGGSVGLLLQAKTKERAAHQHNRKGKRPWLFCPCCLGFEAQMFWFQVTTPTAHSHVTCTCTSPASGRWRGWRAADAAVSAFHL